MRQKHSATIFQDFHGEACPKNHLASMQLYYLYIYIYSCHFFVTKFLGELKKIIEVSVHYHYFFI